MPRKRTVTRRPTYGDAIRWIAYNDNPGEDEAAHEMAGYLTVLLVADLFGAKPYSVAVDVQRTRHGAGQFATQ